MASAVGLRRPAILARVGFADTTGLLESAGEGNEAAREALLDRLRPRIVLWVTTRMSESLRAKVEPEDVAQEVLFQVHRDFEGFEGREPGRFYKWVFRIAENRIVDQAHRFGAQKRQPRELPVHTQTSPSWAAQLQEQVARVRSALEKLPQDYKDVIRLHRLEELDYEEVAEVMDRSVNAVRVLYCRARKALGEILGDGEMGAIPARCERRAQEPRLGG
jgi:RNA polymerase sigma-70 factor (ECF subfamily)